MLRTRVCIFFAALIALMGCTAPRRLTKKFSEKPAAVTERFRGESYANAPADHSRRYTVARYKLWDVLAWYRQENDTLATVPEQAIVRLSLTESDMLEVSAYQEGRFVAGFAIPVRKRGKYLVLKKERRVIPIPIIYFRVDEKMTILSPLENNRIGFHSFSDDTLWILFFGASNTRRSIEEYERVDDSEAQWK